jgi:uncharacterized protein (TIGR02145 family)
MKILILCLVLLSGSIYCQNTVQLGTQTWMTKNLDVTQFKNGDPIPQAQTDEAWQEAGFSGKAAWCYVTITNEDGVNQELKRYGKLYNSFAINDPRGIAPEGWRISSTDDWGNLEQYISGSNFQLSDLISVKDWDTLGGTNKTGLNIEPAGWRDVGCGGVGGSVTYWCEAIIDPTADETTTNTLSVVQYEDGSIGFQYGETSWIMGHYVRCVKLD